MMFVCLIEIKHISTDHINNLKRDPLEIQHPTFGTSRLGLIESVYERYWHNSKGKCKTEIFL